MAKTYSYDVHARAFPTDANEADLLVLSSGQEFLGKVHVCNKDTQERTYRIALTDTGTGVAAADEDFRRYDWPLQKNRTHSVECALKGPGTIRIKASIGSMLSFHAEGMIITTT